MKNILKNLLNISRRNYQENIQVPKKGKLRELRADWGAKAIQSVVGHWRITMGKQCMVTFRQNLIELFDVKYHYVVWIRILIIDIEILFNSLQLLKH